MTTFKDMLNFIMTDDKYSYNKQMNKVEIICILKNKFSTIERLIHKKNRMTIIKHLKRYSLCDRIDHISVLKYIAEQIKDESFSCFLDNDFNSL